MNKILHTAFLICFFNFCCFAQDLKIQKFSLNSENIGIGAFAKTTVTVYNNSPNTSTSFDIGYYFSKDSILEKGDVFLNSSYVETLEGFAFKTLTAEIKIPETIAEGNYYIISMVDYKGQIFETDETNNKKAANFTAGIPFIDLRMTKIVQDRSEYTAGSNCYLTITERNFGNAKNDGHNLSFRLSKDSVSSNDDYGLAFTDFRELYGGEEYTIRYSFSLPDNAVTGKYYVLIDKGEVNSPIEVVTQKRMIPYQIIIALPSFDLQIKSFKIDSDTIKPGLPFKSTVIMESVGNYSVIDSYYGLFISADTVYNIGDTFLQFYEGTYTFGNQTYTHNSTVYIPDKIPAGLYYILAVADYHDNIPETVETNNQKVKAVKCIGKSIITGLESNEEINLANFYPNPASEIVHVGSLDINDVIVISSLEGHEMIHLDSKEIGNDNIDLSKFEPGIYHVQKIRNGEIIARTKLLIQK